MKRAVTIVFRLLVGCVILGYVLWLWISSVPVPERISYGVSFNIPYARELGLDWEMTYRAILDDLEVRQLRLAAHWPLVEPADDAWNFSELDRQMELAETYGARVVLAVGRRLPRWPECHVPAWAASESWEQQREEIREYVRAVVNRYKDSPALAYWQVENEPFLTVFAFEHCGFLDEEFLDEELTLVRSVDQDTPILVTDSGNLGTWFGAYRRGDLFGTSVYVYLFNPETGPFRTILPPETYTAKQRAMELLFGKKETLLIELSLEPWLNESAATAPIETQLERMPVSRMDEILAYAEKTKLGTQYLWGAEWWYWLKEKHKHPEYWERARRIFSES